MCFSYTRLCCFCLDCLRTAWTKFSIDRPNYVLGVWNRIWWESERFDGGELCHWQANHNPEDSLGPRQFRVRSYQRGTYDQELFFPRSSVTAKPFIQNTVRHGSWRETKWCKFCSVYPKHAAHTHTHTHTHIKLKRESEADRTIYPLFVIDIV